MREREKHFCIHQRQQSQWRIYVDYAVCLALASTRSIVVMAIKFRRAVTDLKKRCLESYKSHECGRWLEFIYFIIFEYKIKDDYNERSHSSLHECDGNFKLRKFSDHKPEGGKCRKSGFGWKLGPRLTASDSHYYAGNVFELIELTILRFTHAYVPACVTVWDLRF